MKSMFISAILATVVTSSMAHAEALKAYEVLKENSQETNARIVETFKNHNPGWESASVTPKNYTPFIHHAFRRVGGELSKGPATLQRAKAFLLHNAALLGLTASDIETLNFKEIPGTLGNVFVQSTHPIRYEGYWSVQNFGYDVSVFLTVREGGIESILNRTENLNPPTGLETQPRIAALDPVIIGSIVGRELFYSNFAGQNESAGKVLAHEIMSMTLSMGPLFTEEGVRLGLVWKYHVERGHLPWDFYFSAIDGSLVAIRQGFAT